MRFLAGILLFALTLAGCAAKPYPEPSIREPVRDFAKWERIRDRERANPSFTPEGLDGLPPEKNRDWLRLAESAGTLPRREILKRVNLFFNQWPYTREAGDVWTTPRVFARVSGDCEEFAITKYYALRFLGVPAEDLRIAAVWNARRGEGHAVLLVLTEGQSLLLDCLTDTLRTWEDVRHYRPVFYVNEEYLWTLPRMD